MDVSARIVTLDLAETFRISYLVQDTVDVVQVEVRRQGVTGCGEATPFSRYGETAESALEYVEASGDAATERTFLIFASLLPIR